MSYGRIFINILLVIAFYSYKYTKKYNSIINDFFKRYGKLMTENIKQNNRIDFGISHEINWKTFWNPYSPRETLSFFRVFFSVCIQIVLTIIVIAFANRLFDKLIIYLSYR